MKNPDKQIKKYIVKNPDHIFYNHIFNGYEIIICDEKRIWDSSTIGRSYPAIDCDVYYE